MTKKVRAIFDGKVLCPEKPVELKVNDRYGLNVEPFKEERYFYFYENVCKESIDL